MQRPIMNPSFVADPDAPGLDVPLYKRLGRLIGRLVMPVLHLLLMDPLSIGRPARETRDGTRMSRFMRGLLYRLACLPVLIGLTIAAMVYLGTHPLTASMQLDPASEGLYYDPVNFLSGDGTPLEAWVVPLVDAKKIVTDGD